MDSRLVPIRLMDSAINKDLSDVAVILIWHYGQIDFGNVLPTFLFISSFD